MFLCLSYLLKAYKIFNFVPYKMKGSGGKLWLEETLLVQRAQLE